MKTLFIFLTGYCVAEIVSHLVFYFGKALPFTAFGMKIDTAFNNKALIFYGVLALVFFYFGFLH
jgi:hypothetical protein